MKCRIMAAEHNCFGLFAVFLNMTRFPYFLDVDADTHKKEKKLFHFTQYFIELGRVWQRKTQGCQIFLGI
jgi:hypothetical protein